MPQLARHKSLVLFPVMLTVLLVQSLTHPNSFCGGGLKPALTQ